MVYCFQIESVSVLPIGSDSRVIGIRFSSDWDEGVHYGHNNSKEPSETAITGFCKHLINVTDTKIDEIILELRKYLFLKSTFKFCLP